MSQIITYLTFNGNCREAMTFYKECLGGELTFQTVGQSPLSEKMPKRMKNCILHSTLSKDKILLMGSDLLSENGLVRGNSVSLSLICNSEKEIKTCYKKLSSGGSKDQPLANNFSGALFGDLTDKYGNHWILQFHKTI